MFDYSKEAEELDYEFLSGDPRRCPRHPHVKTSSDDGMFDAPCDECEYEMDQAAAKWDMDPTNPRRSQCGDNAYIVRCYPWRAYVTCVPDELCF
jgi:hypothetical protein